MASPTRAKPEKAGAYTVPTDLEPLLVPLDDLHPDPENVRTHDDRNLGPRYMVGYPSTTAESWSVPRSAT